MFVKRCVSYYFCTTDANQNNKADLKSPSDMQGSAFQSKASAIFVSAVVVLAVNLYLFQADKYMDILNFEQPFVPMRRSVAFKGNTTNIIEYLMCPRKLFESNNPQSSSSSCIFRDITEPLRTALAEGLNFKVSSSPRWWLTMHLT